MGKKRLHSCSRCSYVTDSAQKIQFHIHANKNREILYCPSCDFSACTSQILNVHRRVQHELEPRQKNMTRDKSNLKMTITAPTHVPKASVLATERSELTVNIAQVRLSTLKKPLGSASKGLSSIGDWINEEKPFKCCYCLFRSESMSEVQGHMKVHQREKKEEGFFKEEPENLKIEAGAQDFEELEDDVDSEDEDEVYSSEEELSEGELEEEVSEEDSEGTEALYNVQALYSPECKQNPDYEQFTEEDLKSGSEVPLDLEEEIGDGFQKEAQDILKKETRMYGCSFCSYVSSKRNRVKDHERSHTGERPFACDQCEYTAIWRSNLTKHKLTHLKYSADTDYGQADGLNLSSDGKNPTAGPDKVRERKYPCSYCSYRAFSKQHIQRHEASHERGTLSWKTGKRRVSDTHRPRNYPCRFCEHRSYTRQDVVKHETKLHSINAASNPRAESVKNVAKPVIPKPFHKEPWKLKILDTSSRDSRERPFPCSFCSHRSFRRQDLAKHELTHLGKQQQGFF